MTEILRIKLERRDFQNFREVFVQKTPKISDIFVPQKFISDKFEINLWPISDKSQVHLRQIYDKSQSNPKHIL